MKDQRTPVSEGQAKEVGRMFEDAARKYKGGKESLELAKGHPKFIEEAYNIWDRLAAEQALRLPIIERPAWKVIKPGAYKSADDYRKALKETGFRVGDLANDMMKQPAFKIVDEPIDVELVLVTVAELGFPQGATRKDIYDKALSLGLQLCPPEIGPALRLDYQDQPSGEYILVGMEPIVDSGGGPDVFRVKHDGSDQWLNADYDLPAFVWHADRRWVFCRK